MRASRFTGVQGDRILAEAVFVSGTNFTPRIQIIAPNGTVLGNTYAPARLDLVLPQSGTYTAVVFDASSFYPGEYAFTLFCTSGACSPTSPPPPQPAPERIAACEPEPTDMFPFLGTLITCDIAPGTDTDLYRFDARNGDRVLVEALKLGGHANFTPRLELIAPDGTVLGGAPYAPARLDLLLPQTGVYTAIVFDASSFYPGDYAFTVSCTGGGCLSLRSVPTATLTLTGCTQCRVGDQLSVGVRWHNPGPARLTEVKVGLRFPDGTPVNLFGNRHLEFDFPAGFDLSTTLLSFPWPGGLPTGQWTVETTLVGPDLGDQFSREVKAFTVVP